VATEFGLDARELFDTDQYAEEVREDERLAASLGIHGVPFFVLNGRYGIEGAQPAEVLLEALVRLEVSGEAA
jgi:protein disulfide-isomerase